MRFARRDVRDHNAFLQKRPRTFVSPLASIAAVETSKHRLSRDFGSLSIFDIFNSIGHQLTLRQP
jgi:hypothetical protein